MYQYESSGQLTMLDMESPGKIKKPPKPRASKPDSDLIAVPYFHLNLSPDHVDLFGCHNWELRSPWREGKPPLNTGVAPRKPIRTSLSNILEPNSKSKYYLTKTACLGILRRAEERGKELPDLLKRALEVQAGVRKLTGGFTELKTFHINQRDEGIDLHGVFSSLMATQNAQMQTFVTGAQIAFAANQRDEVRDLHDIAGTLGAQPGMKQQTFIASFSAGAGAAAGGIGYSEQVTPTLKGSASGNSMPSVLCLNDQGGSVMECSENVSGTLRAQEHGHQPLVVSAMLFENHGIDSRYTGPHEISPTLSARAGTGGNNLPLALHSDETFCIMGNAIDRQPHNGGNGIGYQTDIAYTLTATDHHAVFSRQRVDVFRDEDIASTQSARQHKDATDLICQPSYQQNVGALTSSDRKGPNSQYVSQDKCVVEGPFLIRRLTPMECEPLYYLLC